MTDDQILLRAFNAEGSETAFARLVDQHLDFVYCIALRILKGDEHLAQDVSQTVFIDLASKAATLVHRTDLAGWLHTSTCHAAAKAIRSEQRRRSREQKAHMIQEQSRTEGHGIDWDQLRPALDALMLELKECDREALLLRFFKKCSFVDIGGRLGLTENAARMRVERALQKLRNRMARRGFTSSESTLTMLLAHQSFAAAPNGLAATIVSSSLAKAASTTVQSSMAVFASIPALTVVVGLVTATLLTGTLVVHRRNTRLEQRNAILEARLMKKASAMAGELDERESAEMIRLRRENAELIALRERAVPLQASPARERTSTSLSDKGESDKSDKLAFTGDDSSATALSKSPEIPMSSADTWAHQGFATPISTLQTLHWALSNRDAKSFAAANLWDTPTLDRASVLFAELPASVRRRLGSLDQLILDWAVRQSRPISSYRVLLQEELGPNHWSLVEQCQDVDGQVREVTVLFRRDDASNWRRVVAIEEMPKLEAMIRDLAKPPSTASARASE